jgi:hypothetical protein
MARKAIMRWWHRAGLVPERQEMADQSVINRSITNPTFTRRIEEKASEGAECLWSFLQAAHGRNDLAFEVGLAGCYHATHGVGLEMFHTSSSGLRSGE